jgi:hypothetical protein
MNPEETNQETPTNLVQCVFHAHGCTDLVCLLNSSISSFKYLFLVPTK